MTSNKCAFLLGIGALMLSSVAANASQIQFSITNTSPSGGLWIMRPWIGLQDGGYQTYTVGQAATSGVQHEAEDGVTGDPANLLPPSNVCSGAAAVYTASSPCLYDSFNSYAGHGQQASIGNPTAPGSTLSAMFNVDPHDPNSQFLSYLVMIVPSNDAFFGTPTGAPIRLFDASGNFNGGNGNITLAVTFAGILDAGTEINTEAASDTAFLGQSVNGTGPRENGVVTTHGLFGSTIVNGSNGFGGHTNTFPNANYQGQIATITISQTPEPATFALFGFASALLWAGRRFRNRIGSRNLRS